MSDKINDNEYCKEILLWNYWEHIKAEKELSRIQPPENSYRKIIRRSAELILEKIKEYETL
jgi:hypothetical protein